MSRTEPVALGERIPAWPRISAIVTADGTGTLTINGTERPCAAESIESLRTGIIARCVAIATTMSRPVAVTVSEGGNLWPLAVRPEGIVQPLSPSGTVAPAAGLSVHEGRCRHCRQLQLVTAAACSKCGIPEPHRVETTPLDVQNVLNESVQPSAPVEHHDELELTHQRTTPEPPTTRPAIRLTMSTGEPVILTRNAALGRNPKAVDGRQVVQLASPTQMLSRTHAFVDVDDAGRIVVTDYHSGNGIEVKDEALTRLSPGIPYVVAPGTTLLLGDVLCTIAFDTPPSDQF